MQRHSATPASTGDVAPPPSCTSQQAGAWGRCRQLYASGCGRASLVAPGRNVQIVRPLEDVEVMEKEGATFSCEVSHDEVPAQWFREGSKLRVSDNVRIRQEGMTVTAVGCWEVSPPPPGHSPSAE